MKFKSGINLAEHVTKSPFDTPSVGRLHARVDLKLNLFFHLFSFLGELQTRRGGAAHAVSPVQRARGPRVPLYLPRERARRGSRCEGYWARTHLHAKGRAGRNTTQWIP